MRMCVGDLPDAAAVACAGGHAQDGASRYLLAQTCLRLGKLAEAEAALDPEDAALPGGGARLLRRCHAARAEVHRNHRWPVHRWRCMNRREEHALDVRQTPHACCGCICVSCTPSGRCGL